MGSEHITKESIKKKYEQIERELGRDTLKYGTKSIEQFHRWLFEVAAFASGAIIIAGTLIGRSEPSIFKPFFTMKSW